MGRHTFSISKHAETKLLDRRKHKAKENSRIIATGDLTAVVRTDL